MKLCFVAYQSFNGMYYEFDLDYKDFNKEDILEEVDENINPAYN